MRRENKTLSNLISQVSALIKKWKHESKSASPKKGTIHCFWKNSKKGKLISFDYSIKINGLRFSLAIYKCSCDIYKCSFNSFIRQTMDNEFSFTIVRVMLQRS